MFTAHSPADSERPGLEAGCGGKPPVGSGNKPLLPP